MALLGDDALTDLRARSIGFIFQTFNLIPVLSALENVEFPLLFQKRKDGRARARRALEEVGLLDFAHHRPDELSGGQRQRVAVARALVTDPVLVLADEPTANLDTATGEAIISLMLEINRRDGTTFLFSTHDPRVMLARPPRAAPGGRAHLSGGRLSRYNPRTPHDEDRRREDPPDDGGEGPLQPPSGRSWASP